MNQRPNFCCSMVAGCLISCLLIATASGQKTPATNRVGSGQAGQQKLHAILDPIMDQAVANSQIPGGVLLIGHNGRVIYRKAFGSRSLEPTREPMTEDTIFDLARSLNVLRQPPLS